jgi:hypothetical protein
MPREVVARRVCEVPISSATSTAIVDNTRATNARCLSLLAFLGGGEAWERVVVAAANEAAG